MSDAMLPFASAQPDERARLNSQSAAILERLHVGPVTNWELSQIAMKYTSRISDLRKRGHRIRVQEHDRSTGRVVYALELAQ